jgi:hypothetical protein
MIIRGISLLFLIGALSLKAEPTIEIDTPVLKFLPKRSYFMLRIMGAANQVYTVEFSKGDYDRGKLEWIYLADIQTNSKGRWVSPLTRVVGPQAFFRARVKGGSGIQN